MTSVRRSASWWRFAGLVLAAACSDAGPRQAGISIHIDGLPAGATPSIVVIGPNQFFASVSADTRLDAQTAGRYTITASALPTADAYYASRDSVQTVELSAGGSADATVHYEIAGGAVHFTATGIPSGAQASIRIVGSQLSKTLKPGETVGGLPSGIYTVAADTLVASDDRFVAQSAPSTITVSASRTPVELAATYAMITANIVLAIDGLPDVNSSPVTVTGPNGFRRTLGVTATLHGLAPGTYTVSAVRENGCPFVAMPSQSQQMIDLRAGQIQQTQIHFTREVPPASALDLRIAGVQLVQVVQDSAGSVPAIAGRPTIARVFVVANQCNSARPDVVVTLNTGRRVRVPSPPQDVPLTSGSPTMTTSWNVLLDSSEVTPQLTIAAEVDPDNGIAEADETNNRFSFVGAGVVRRVPVLKLVLVPLTIGAFTPSITADNLADYLSVVRNELPVGQIDVRIDPPLVSALPGFSGGDGINTLLAEVDRRSQSGDPDAHYVGLYLPAPNAILNGTGGMGQIGGRSAVTMDMMWYPPGSRLFGAQLFAHELTHTFGRLHAPACNAPFPDPQYPHSGGVIGIAGYNVVAAAATGDVNPVTISATTADVMAYCNTSWISDYTFLGVMRFRDSVAALKPSARQLRGFVAVP